MNLFFLSINNMPFKITQTCFKKNHIFSVVSMKFHSVSIVQHTSFDETFPCIVIYSSFFSSLELLLIILLNSY